MILLFVSCATGPKTTIALDDAQSALARLPAGAKLYLWVDAVKARPLLDVLSYGGKSGKDAALILDSTSSAAAAFFQGEENQERRFFIAANGNYPSFRVNFSFTFNRGWKKLKSPSGGSYWYSKADALALTLGAKLSLVSNIDPLAFFNTRLPPDGFFEYQRGLVLSGWLDNPQESINKFLASMGIPLQMPAEELFFGASRTMEEQEPWELVFKIKTASTIHARSLLSLFSLTRLFILRGVETQKGIEEEGPYLSPEEAALILFANIPDQDGQYLTLRSAALNEGKIALLFNLFSLYSD